MEFKDWLRDFARENGWTQQILASKVGVSQTTVSQWMSGSDKPRPEAVVKLADLSGEGLQLFRIVYGLPLPDPDARHEAGVEAILRRIMALPEDERRQAEKYIDFLLQEAKKNQDAELYGADNETTGDFGVDADSLRAIANAN